MFIGRTVECERIARLVAEMRAGHAGSLVIRGEPGVGKTQLLSWLVREADGIQVLRADGTEAEREIPFAALLGLVHPVVSYLDEVPDRQAVALRGALGLGPPLANSRFLIGGATLSLLAAVAERSPLLVLVDDLQWIDEPSADALLFAARRILADRIAMVFAIRDAAAVPAGHQLEEMVLEGFGHQEFGDLLSAVDDRQRTAAVEKLLFELSGGNPLALEELVRRLDDDELSGRRALPELPPVGRKLESVYAARVNTLPAPTREALLVLAVSGSETPAEAQRVLAVIMQRDLAVLNAAEVAELLTVTETAVRFRHPLVRSAIYHAVRASERRRVHAAMADTFPKGTARRAAHLAAGVVGVDARIASELEEIARGAAGRSGYASAAATFERAARISESDGDRSRRLVDASRAALSAGDLRWSRGLLDRAQLYTDDPRLRGELLALDGHIAHLGGDVGAGELMRRAANLVAPEDPARAVTILAHAVESCVFAGRHEELSDIAHQLVSLASPDDPRQRFFAELTMSTAELTVGRRESGLGHAEQAVRLVEAGLPPFDDPHHRAWTAIAPTSLGQFDTALALLRETIAQLRDIGAVGALPFALRFTARVCLQLGRWHQAYVAASEGLQLARDTGQIGQVGDCLAVIAAIEAVLGRDDACREHAGEAITMAKTLGLVTFRAHGENALGLLELGAGRPGSAAGHFERALALTGRSQVGAFQVAASDLVETYLRLGERDKAVSIYHDQLEPLGLDLHPSTQALVQRSRGLLADDESFRENFEAALDQQRGGGQSFEAARTQLAFGERLRREGARQEARDHLQAAQTVFETIDAAPWAEQARQGLRASGERLRPRRDRSTGELTPQELQIALTVAGGSSNREVAAALFLSRKTVEWHLTRVYRKLDLRSRSELVLHFAHARKPNVGRVAKHAGVSPAADQTYA